MILLQSVIIDEAKRTRVDIKGGQHPVWDEELRFPIFSDPSDRHRILQITCFQKNRGQRKFWER